jgi:hypothetical protein
MKLRTLFVLLITLILGLSLTLAATKDDGKGKTTTDKKSCCSQADSKGGKQAKNCPMMKDGKAKGSKTSGKMDCCKDKASTEKPSEKNKETK